MSNDSSINSKKSNLLFLQATLFKKEQKSLQLLYVWYLIKKDMIKFISKTNAGFQKRFWFR